MGKVYMAKAGLFDDLDASLDWHPGLETKVGNQSGQAMNNFEVEFFGQAAHAAADPWNGRSALDAVEIMNYGANMMREHVRPTARIHYVIPAAGEAPNVVPAYARVWYYVRDTARAPVDDYYERLNKIAEGAALATRTEFKVSLLTGVHAMLLNRPLQEAMQANLEFVGGPDFTEEDQAFAKELQEFLGVEAKGLAAEVKPLKTSRSPRGRIDRRGGGQQDRPRREPLGDHRRSGNPLAQLGHDSFPRYRGIGAGSPGCRQGAGPHGGGPPPGAGARRTRHVRSSTKKPKGKTLRITCSCRPETSHASERG